MLGFVVGTVCLVGLVRLLRGPRYGRSCGWHHHHSRGGCGDDWRYRGRSTRESFDGRDVDDAGGFDDAGPVRLRALFQGLQTTPGQERVIGEALKELKGSFQKAGAAQRKSARDLADALRGDSLSMDAMGGVCAASPRRRVCR